MRIRPSCALPGLAVLLVALPLAGCIAPAERVQAALAAQRPAPPVSVLAGAVEPAGLEAPRFRLLGPVAKGAQASLLGEPSLAAGLDGALYLSFPGCESSLASDRFCAHGPVYRSADAGATWERLNQGRDSHLVADNTTYANGDADIAVDGAGTAWATDLGNGVQVFRSADAGATWTWAGNVTPPGHWSDRQWVAAAGPGHIVVAWMGGATRDQRAVAVNATLDGGRTWTNTTYLGAGVGWLGPVRFDPAGTRAYLPFTQKEQPDPGLPDPTGIGAGSLLGLAGAASFRLLVARSADGGGTWDVVDTGARVVRSATGLHWAGTLMAPALGVTGDGHVVLAWSEETTDPAGAAQTGAVLRYVASGDHGATWSKPVQLSDGPVAIMPWVTGGAGDRFAVTAYVSSVPLDSEYAGRWDVVATVVDGAGSAGPAKATQVVDHDVHQGGVCTRGGVCLLAASDRSLLDFFQSALLPDGRLAIAYPADPVAGGKTVEIRFALQDGGTPLLARPAGSTSAR